MRPVLRYPGSKARLAGRIVAMMPEHGAYLEPFFGSGAVLMNKARCSTETVNDLDGNVVNFFTVLRDQPDLLAGALALTPYARDELARPLVSDDPVERARWFAVALWQSREGAIRGSSHFRVDVNGRALAATWARLPGKIFDAAQRMVGVQIENRDAVALIDAAQPGTLIYADPPYVGLELYGVGFTFQDHERFLEAAVAHDGPVLISGRESGLYDRRLQGWDRQVVETKKMKNVLEDEIVWRNYAST
ncbi:MAG TPA: DNA adenine methylase [Actinomycetota bacterium]